MCFCFVLLPFFPSASWHLSFLSLFLSLSSSSYLAWFMRECLTGVGLLCMDTLSCIHGVGRWLGSRPAAWNYVPVQSYSCSLCAFYRTLVLVGKDSHYTLTLIIIHYTTSGYGCRGDFVIISRDILCSNIYAGDLLSSNIVHLRTVGTQFQVFCFAYFCSISINLLRGANKIRVAGKNLVSRCHVETVPPITIRLQEGPLQSLSGGQTVSLHQTLPLWWHFADLHYQFINW